MTDPYHSGSLIYEYIGEVVAEKTFRKRMAAYAQEGIRHFYFMMLQKEEVGHSLAIRDVSLMGSISMLRRKVGSDDLQTTLVIQIPRCRNGWWEGG